MLIALDITENDIKSDQSRITNRANTLDSLMDEILAAIKNVIDGEVVLSNQMSDELERGSEAYPKRTTDYRTDC